MDQHTQQQAADAAAGLSAVSAASVWIVEAAPWIEAAAGCVAIVAGLAAAWYHIDKTVAARRERKARERGRKK